MALLELARLFSLLYSNPKTRGRYNLLFGLTSGGPYNYNGTHKVLGTFLMGYISQLSEEDFFSVSTYSCFSLFFTFASFLVASEL